MKGILFKPEMIQAINTQGVAMAKVMCRAWTGDIMFCPFPRREQKKHPGWTFMLGLEWQGQILYELDILRWMADDGECYKGLVELRENECEESCFLVGLCITNPINISDEVTSEDGEILEGWNGEPQVIANILENPGCSR